MRSVGDIELGAGGGGAEGIRPAHLVGLDRLQFLGRDHRPIVVLRIQRLGVVIPIDRFTHHSSHPGARFVPAPLCKPGHYTTRGPRVHRRRDIHVS